MMVFLRGFLAPAVVAFAARDGSRPTAVAHGMGDSCFNYGMKHITNLIGETLGTYSVCVPTGDNRISDTKNGYFMTMDDNVDVFAAKVRADENLKDGFNCVGFSQGTMLCRGYIHKVNCAHRRLVLSVRCAVQRSPGGQFPVGARNRVGRRRISQLRS